VIALACCWAGSAGPVTAQVSPAAEPECPAPAWENRRRIRPGAPPPQRDCAGADSGPPELTEFVAVPDRWRLLSTLLGYAERRFNPYAGNNVMKGDRPAFGEDWFFSLGLVADTVLESRSLPTPVGAAASRPDRLDVLGADEQSLYDQRLLIETVLYKGDTVFKPPDLELRFIPVLSFNRVRVEEIGVLTADPSVGRTRRDSFVGIQGLFVDKHLRNVSQRYDFDSLRVGIQPITTDFRGFLFQDSPFGVRLFGTRNNNLWQYNLAWLRRVEKDVNSGLNDLTDLSAALRDDDVLLFNVYRQDFPWLGFTSSVGLVHNRNRESGAAFYDGNGFIARPASLGSELARDYDVTYVGVHGEGHVGRVNLSLAGYFAAGDETPSTFSDRRADIRAAFSAAEISRDHDWWRIRGSLVYASGDDDPFDDEANGFDAVFENPLIAGADTSFWIRQAVPLVGGGRVTLAGRNGLLNSMRSSKEIGQSNFTNPGLRLIGVGADLELTPRIRLSFNLNQLEFDETRPVEVARNQGAIDADIGLDLSVAVTYRPLINQHVVVRLSAAALDPGKGYEQLFGSSSPHSVLLNVVLSY
jgi:hypothetical protein